MNYRYLKVSKTLSAYVQSVLVIDPSIGADGSDLPLFTNGMPALLCHTQDGDHQVTFFGQSIPAEQWKKESDVKIIAYFFKPFAMGTIFKLSAQILKEKSLEISLWNAQTAMALKVQLMHSKSWEERVSILDHFIFTQLQKHRRECDIIRYATDQLMQNTDVDILSHVLNELHLTERTFQRIFKKYVGISANEYRRICQFTFAFSQLKGRHFDKQTDVAFTNGYFDQSHFIRSFKEFTDMTPHEYLEEGLGNRNI